MSHEASLSTSKQKIKVRGLGNDCGLFALAVGTSIALQKQPCELHAIPQFIQTIEKDDMVPYSTRAFLYSRLLRQEFLKSLRENGEYKEECKEKFVSLCRDELKEKNSNENITYFVNANLHIIDFLTTEFQKLKDLFKDASRFSVVAYNPSEVEKEDFKNMLLDMQDQTSEEMEVNLNNNWPRYSTLEKIQHYCYLLSTSWEQVFIDEAKTESEGLKGQILKEKITAHIAELMLLYLNGLPEFSENYLKAIYQFAQLNCFKHMPGCDINEEISALHCKYRINQRWEEIYNNYLQHIENISPIPTADELGCLARAWKIKLEIDFDDIDCISSLSAFPRTVKLKSFGLIHWEVVVDNLPGQIEQVHSFVLQKSHKALVSPLEIFKAELEGDLEALQELFSIAEEGGNTKDLLAARDSYGRTILMCASCEGHLELARWLIKDKHISAAEKKNIRSELYKGWNDHGSTALLYAALNGHLKFVEWLINEKHATLDERDSSDANVLMCAAWNGHLNLVKWLVEQCPQLLDQKDVKGDTALHYAIDKCHLKVIQFLAEKKPELLKDKSILISAGHWDWQSFNILRQMVKELRLEDEIVEAIEKENLVRVKEIIGENPSFCRERNKFTETAVLLAVKKGHLELVKLLAKEKLIPTLSGLHSEGKSILNWAVQSRSEPLIKWMVEKFSLLVNKNVYSEMIFDAIKTNNLYLIRLIGKCIITFLPRYKSRVKEWMDNNGASILNKQVEALKSNPFEQVLYVIFLSELDAAEDTSELAFLCTLAALNRYQLNYSIVDFSNEFILAIFSKLLKKQLTQMFHKYKILLTKYLGKLLSTDKEKLLALFNKYPQYLYIFKDAMINTHPRPTKFDSDSAFHAIFGKWDGGRYVCEDVEERRNILALNIKNSKTGDFLHALALERIKYIIIESNIYFGKHAKILKKKFQEYKKNINLRQKECWRKFEDELMKHKHIVEHIKEKFERVVGASGFELIFNTTETLRAEVLSIPELDFLYEQYCQYNLEDFCEEEKISENKDVLNAYADFIKKSGNWLWPDDLEILAHVFKINIDIKMKNPYTGEINEKETIKFHGTNLDNVITISFNGRNHFEYIDDIFDAVVRGNLSEVRRIVARNPHLLQQRNKFNETPLVVAVINGHLDLVKWFVNDKKVPLTENITGPTSLFFAACLGDLKLFQWLVEEAGVSLTEDSNNGDAYLVIAALFGHLKLIQWLAEEKGVSLTAEDENRYSPLLLAAAGGCFDLVQWLVDEMEVSLNEKAIDGDTVLLIAAKGGPAELVQPLEDTMEVTLNEKNSNFSIIVLPYGRKLVVSSGANLALIKWLVNEKNVPLEEKNNNGDTIFSIAIKQKNLELMLWVVEKSLSSSYFDPIIQKYLQKDKLSLIFPLADKIRELNFLEGILYVILMSEIQSSENYDLKSLLKSETIKAYQISNQTFELTPDFVFAVFSLLIEQKCKKIIEVQKEFWVEWIERFSDIKKQKLFELIKINISEIQILFENKRIEVDISEENASKLQEQSKHFDILNKLESSLDSKDQLPQSEFSIQLYQPGNSATKFFKKEGALNFNNWYDHVIDHYDLHTKQMLFELIKVIISEIQILFEKQSKHFDILNKLESSLDSKDQLPQSEFSIQLYQPGNSATKFFKKEGALNFNNWYHPDICHYLLHMSINNAKCIRVLFPDADQGNNTKTFKDQLSQLIMLSSLLKKSALFISKEPGADNHFICGIIKGDNLLFINPLGITKHIDCYQTLGELQKENIIKNIWFSSTVLQKKDYEEGLVSCGPISLELAMHILGGFSSEDLEKFWINHLKINEPTVHEASQLTYHGINIKILLPLSLRELVETSEEQAYIDKICCIRQNHCYQLQILSQDYLVKCKEASPAQVCFDSLMTGYKNINNIELLEEYNLLKQELDSQSMPSIILSQPADSKLEKTASEKKISKNIEKVETPLQDIKQLPEENTHDNPVKQSLTEILELENYYEINTIKFIGSCLEVSDDLQNMDDEVNALKTQLIEKLGPVLYCFDSEFSRANEFEGPKDEPDVESEELKGYKKEIEKIIKEFPKLAAYRNEFKCEHKYKEGVLHYAMKRKDVTLVRLLLSLNANIERRSDTGISPIDIAREVSFEEGVSLIQEYRHEKSLDISRSQTDKNMQDAILSDIKNNKKTVLNYYDQLYDFFSKSKKTFRKDYELLYEKLREILKVKGLNMLTEGHQKIGMEEMVGLWTEDKFEGVVAESMQNFIQSAIKGGFINMSRAEDSIVSYSSKSKSHSFWSANSSIKKAEIKESSPIAEGEKTLGHS
jgi:ankyrin repeat protein